MTAPDAALAGWADEMRSAPLYRIVAHGSRTPASGTLATLIAGAAVGMLHGPVPP